ncbi:MAG TPA: LD-carboxypeptidase, partial [Cyanobacteria bacterium UBA8543]|nr:LD-carboxypeptidase [Cyanobacteria bacterium UBA8543]
RAEAAEGAEGDKRAEGAEGQRSRGATTNNQQPITNYQLPITKIMSVYSLL